MKNEPVVSAGFPPIGVARRAELSTRPGRVDQLVKLDAVDRLMGKVIAANKMEGLLVDTNLEPGFSGGPTVNAAGEVVGVNVLKDTIHRGQDGAVSVVVLRELMKKIKPFTPPTPADAEALLKRTQEEYMVLPVDDRAGVAPTAYIGTAELPHIREMIAAMRSMDGDRRLHEVSKGAEVSNQALLGMLLARLPGKSLETYQASSTRDRIEKCEEKRLAASSASSGPWHDGDGPHAGEHRTFCDAYAARPVAWDLVASTLEWEGAVREYKVTKLEAVDEDAKIYQASVLVPGVASLLPIHMVWEAGALRLELFDKSGRIYALQGARSATARDFEGTWAVTQARRPEPGTEGVESERSERIVVSISGTDAVSVVQEYIAAALRDEGGVPLQHGQDHHHEGGAVALRPAPQRRRGPASADKFEYLENGCKDCKLCYSQDRAFVLKRYGRAPPVLPDRRGERAGGDRDDPRVAAMLGSGPPNPLLRATFDRIERLLARAPLVLLEEVLALSALAVAAYAVVAPFVVARYPPMTDLPFHAAQTSILRHYSDPAYHFREQFELHPLARSVPVDVRARRAAHAGLPGGHGGEDRRRRDGRRSCPPAWR